MRNLIHGKFFPSNGFYFFSSQMNTNKKGLKSYVRELLMTLYHLINCYSVIRLVFHIHGIL